MLRDALSPLEFSVNWTAGQRLGADVLVKEALMAPHGTEAGVTGASQRGNRR
jgi:hypothetical protein